MLGIQLADGSWFFFKYVDWHMLNYLAAMEMTDDEAPHDGVPYWQPHWGVDVTEGSDFFNPEYN